MYNGNDWLTGVEYPDATRVSYACNGAGNRLNEIVETPDMRGHNATVTNNRGEYIDLSVPWATNNLSPWIHDIYANFYSKAYPSAIQFQISSVGRKVK